MPFPTICLIYYLPCIQEDFELTGGTHHHKSIELRPDHLTYVVLRSPDDTYYELIFDHSSGAWRREDYSNSADIGFLNEPESITPRFLLNRGFRVL